MSRAHLRRRIAALNKAINPAGSLGAKIRSLTNEQKESYDKWRNRCAHYLKTRPDGEAYACMIAGEPLPMLRPDIREILFGPSTSIPLGSTETKASEIYRDFLHAK